jgi:hypothetical protein
MGDMADYYMDLAMEQDCQDEADRHFEREALDKMDTDYMMGVLKWKTQSGVRIMVTKMTELHLVNTIEFVKRTFDNKEFKNKWVKLLGYELEKRK